MRITTTQPSSPGKPSRTAPLCQTLRGLLASIPDAPPLSALRQAGGEGPDDYPVSVPWGTLLLTPAQRHSSIGPCAPTRPWRRRVGKTETVRFGQGPAGQGDGLNESEQVRRRNPRRT